MIRFLLALLLLVPAAQAACTKMTMPTDFASVTNGTRANLKANFTEIETRVEPCMDSVDEIRGRFSGYSGSLLMSSLENMRLKLDSDASATALFLIESSSGDSLFRVSEDLTARFFGAVTLPSPIITGTLTAAAAAFSGAVTANNGASVPDAYGLTSEIGGNTRDLVARSGTTLNIGENGGWTGADYNVASGAHSFGVAGSTRFQVNTSGATVTGTAVVSSTLTADSLISAKFYTEGTFTLTGTGFTTSPTGTARYTRVGKMVVLYIPSIQAVSNSTLLTYTGVPAAIRPARTQTVTAEAMVDNTSSILAGFIDVGTDGVLTVTPRTSLTAMPGAFTASNTKGVSGLTITYTLQ
jgi:hypothetical protein